MHEFFQLIITLALAGFLCWLVLQIPMPQPFPRIIQAVIVVFLIFWLMSMFGSIAIPHLH